MKKRILSMVLGICMAITLLPMAAFAAEEVGQGDDGGASSDSGAAIPVIDAPHAPALFTGESAAVPEGVTVDEIQTYGYYVYANGNPILIEGVPNNEAYCRVYIDENRDGAVDDGDTKVSLPGVYYVESIDGYYLSGSFVFGGCRDAEFTGDTSVTLLGSTVYGAMGGGYLGGVTGNTQVTLKDASIGDAIFAGGLTGDVSGKATVSMSGGSCKRIFATQDGTVGESDISVTDRAVVNYLAGGGLQATSYVGKTKVVGDNADLNNVFGGGVLGNTGDTSVTLQNGSDVRFLCGGGSGENGAAATCGNVSITIGGDVNFYGWKDGNKAPGGWVYGGGDGSNTTAQSVTMDVSVGSGTYESWPSIYGGCRTGKVLGDVNITASAALNAILCCAGWTGPVGGSATVTVTGEYNGANDQSYRLFANGGQKYVNDLVAGTTTVLFRDICSTNGAFSGRCSAACPQYFDEVQLENAKIRMNPNGGPAPSQNLTVPAGSELEIYQVQLPIAGNFTGGGTLITGNSGSLFVPGTISGTTALDFATLDVGTSFPDTMPVVTGPNANVSNFTISKPDYLLRQGEGTVEIVKGTAIPLTLTLDKASYQYGETATLTVTPTFPEGTVGVPTGITAVLTAKDASSLFPQNIDGSVDSASGIVTFQVPFKIGDSHSLSVQYMIDGAASTAEKKLTVDQRPLTIKSGAIKVPSRAYNGNTEVEIPAESFEGIVLEGYLDGDSGAVLPKLNRFAQMATADVGNGKAITFGATRWIFRADTQEEYIRYKQYYLVPPTGLTVDITKKQIKDLVYPKVTAPLKEGQRLAEAHLSTGSAECDFAWAQPDHVVRAGEAKDGYAMVATVKSQHAGNMELNYYPECDPATGAVTRQVAVTVQPLPVERRYFAGQETRDTVDLSQMKPFGEDAASFSLVDYTKGTGLTDVALVGTALTYTAKFPQTGDALATITLEASAAGWKAVPVTLVLSADVLPNFGGTATPSVTVPVSSGQGTVNVSATVRNGTARLTVSDRQLAKIAGNASDAGGVSVDLSGLKKVDSAKIPGALIAAANTPTGTGSLEIILPTGTVKLDGKALASVAASHQDVTVSVEEVQTSSLTAAQKEALGDKLDSAVVVDVNVLMNGAKVSDFGGGTLTVSFPYTLKDGQDPAALTIFYVKADGTMEEVGGYYDAEHQCFVFETTHLSQYVLVSNPAVNPFTDVADTAYYYDAVLWAAKKGITGGTSATTFAPDADCTRAQTVTFLWRTMGSPEATITGNPFADVKPDAPYYKAVLWAAEQGVTSGTSATTFSPDLACSRAQVVTLLWRAAGKPVVNDPMDFTDVPADSYYAEAVRWAVSAGITGGTGGKTFGPDITCTRAQIVTFLFRQFGK